MKVLDLRCLNGHCFEGWFGSEEDFQSQQQRSLLQCPVCGHAEVSKGLSAPRLNLGAKQSAAPDSADVERHAQSSSAVGAGREHALQAAWLRAARQLIAHSEDVGDRFAYEARRMHHGEIDQRAIRGQATVGEAVELMEEGIAVLPLPFPDFSKETLQ